MSTKLNASLRPLPVWSVLMLLVAIGGLSVPAEAAPVLIATIPGNDCAGVFGTPPNCVAQNQNPYLAPTPLIIKFDFNDDGTIAETIGNFTSIDGSEFSFTSINGSAFEPINGEWPGTGIWRYIPTPGQSDPLITAYVAKGGPSFNLFSNNGQPIYEGVFVTPPPGNGNNNNRRPAGPAGLSHLSFYDTAVSAPEMDAKSAHMALALLAGGLLLVTDRTRRSRKLGD